MKIQILASAALLIAGISLPAHAAAQSEPADTMPAHRAVILSGDVSNPGAAEHIAMLYSRSNLAFEDPAAPRFLFLDKEGKVALGIGGFLKAVGEYDMNGAIDNDGFVTYDIPAPFDPAQRQRFGATAAHSTIFLKMVARKTPIGRVIVYIQTNFTGDNGGYGLKLKQAYLTVGHVTVGKARSTFADGPAMAPTIDDQGPSGQVTAKNMMLRYETSTFHGLSAAISAELPSATYTTGTAARAISQRFPDIPAYVQYAWDKGDSHVRLSGILRQLSYRDDLKAKNHFATGWGVQLSTVASLIGPLKFFGHATYGKGISDYINDLSGHGLDLVPAATDGRLRAPAALGMTAGLQYNFTPAFFVTASYSRAGVFNVSHMADDTYRYGQYITANAFYNVWGDLRLGLEYIHGTRKNIDGAHGKANRLEAMLQYSF